MRKIKPKEWFVFIIVILLLTDIVILLDIPFLRQILGFLFLTFFSGLLILQILNLNKIGYTEKFILSIGLSISFLILFGLLINNLLLGLGYETPLTIIPLLVSFNLALIVLAIIAYKENKNMAFSRPNINLSISEKAVLIGPILFPALSIFGMHVMNTTNNNIFLMFLLFLIPIYVILIGLFNQKFPKRIYPIVIFLISLSLLLLLSLRSNHITGTDTHIEYYFFLTTLNNQYWSVFGKSAVDAALSISLLPTIYQSILNISPEFIFKILYSVLFSISPLIIYVLSKKYVGEFYAFLASCFFMFQYNFLWTAFRARTNIAILFFAIAMMICFSDKIEPLKKRALFIVFMVSVILSHYSTTYIFFFIILGAFLGMKILSSKYTFKSEVSSTIILLFFTFIFFWYSQITETAFDSGIHFIERTLSNLNNFFIEESRGESVQSLFGEWLTQKSIPYKIEIIFTWLTFAFIGIGVIGTIIRRKDMVTFSKLEKSNILKKKFEVEYLMVAFICSGVLVAMVSLPYISKVYSLDRTYSLVVTILSVFFVVGGMMLSEILSLIWKEKALQVRANLIIMLVLVFYFLSVTGVIYNIFGVPRSMSLNSKGEQYDLMYLHDQEIYGAKWLKNYASKYEKIYSADFFGGLRLTSQGIIPINEIDYFSLIKHREINGYIYLRYTNVVKGELLDYNREIYNLTEYSDLFIKKNEIYDSGGSKIYR